MNPSREITRTCINIGSVTVGLDPTSIKHIVWAGVGIGIAIVTIPSVIRTIRSKIKGINTARPNFDPYPRNYPAIMNRSVGVPADLDSEEDERISSMLEHTSDEEGDRVEAPALPNPPSSSSSGPQQAYRSKKPKTGRHARLTDGRVLEVMTQLLGRQASVEARLAEIGTMLQTILSAMPSIRTNPVSERLEMTRKLPPGVDLFPPLDRKGCP